MKKIEIFDTTLRDGTQSEDINFTVYDKLRLVRVLDAFGIDYIELGWPSSNPKDREVFEKVRDIKLKNASIVAFGSTRRRGISAQEDANLRGIVESGAKVACIFGKTLKEHIGKQLGASNRENLEMIGSSISFLCKNGIRVFYDAEHFFDGYIEDPAYALECLEVAWNAGADRLILCDTMGGTLPLKAYSILKQVDEHLMAKGMGGCLGVHFHNDHGCAVANSVIAAGIVSQIHGTINGFGERTGNADLCQVIPNLVLKEGISLPKIDLKELKNLSETVYTLSNNKPARNQPYVGDNSFAHKGGVHVDAISKGASYEHVPPESVGNRRNIVLSDLSGKANIVEIAKSFGFDVKKDDPGIIKALSEIESLEKRGYAIGTLLAEQYLIMQSCICGRSRPIAITHWKVQTGKRNGEYSEAVMEGEIDGNKGSSFAPLEDAGPVGATYAAMQKLVMNEYPEIAKVRLVNYKVRIAEDRGADSSVRVYVEFRDNGDLWGTAGVSENIIEASLEAIKKGFEYYILKKSEK